MSRDPSDTTPTETRVLVEQHALIERATSLAWRWHGAQTRKGRPTSYMSHLLQVMGLVIDAGGGLDEVIAAVLHDALEDAPDPAARAEREDTIREAFGEAAFTIVLDCTDTTPQEAGEQKGPWRERKERYLAQLAAARPASRLVAACDKRQNLGDLVSDLRVEGPATLDRFNAGPTEQRWYFRSLLELFRPDVPAKLSQELEALLAEFEQLAEI